jgi:hypothetical protein
MYGFAWTLRLYSSIWWIGSPKEKTLPARWKIMDNNKNTSNNGASLFLGSQRVIIPISLSEFSALCFSISSL